MAKYLPKSCPVCGGKLRSQQSHQYSRVTPVVFAHGEKEPRIPMICEKCGLRYAMKGGDA